MSRWLALVIAASALGCDGAATVNSPRSSYDEAQAAAARATCTFAAGTLAQEL